ncbi:hypothetical protein KIPB_011891, partial [Kipferlia bialata]|eukprot:g11891.t1
MQSSVTELGWRQKKTGVNSVLSSTLARTTAAHTPPSICGRASLGGPRTQE